MSTIKLKCQCGSVEGEALNVTPSNGNRVVCCCSDCQAFAANLDKKAETLDHCGGTDIYQTSQSQVKIHKGYEHLKAMQLSPKGLIRWHTSCCNTPVANTMNAAMPFVGLIHTFIDSVDRDEALGPVLAYCQTQDAIAPSDHPKAHAKFPIGITVRIVRKMLVWKLQGKSKPSAFFNKNGTPITDPVLAPR